MKSVDRRLRVFLCHASQDKPVVRELYQRLLAEGWIDPWLDKEKLLMGQDFDLEIEKAVEDADAVIVFISNNAVKKTGYVQKELRLIYDAAMYRPEGDLFAIPLRLENCEPPHRFKLWQWGDYFGDEKERTYASLLKSLRTIYNRVYQLGVRGVASLETEAYIRKIEEGKKEIEERERKASRRKSRNQTKEITHQKEQNRREFEKLSRKEAEPQREKKDPTQITGEEKSRTEIRDLARKRAVVKENKVSGKQLGWEHLELAYQPFQSQKPSLFHFISSKFIPDIAIVSGLGQKGFLFVRDLLKIRRRVIIIEQDINNPYLSACKNMGAKILVGDARNKSILIKAGVHRAQFLIVVCGEDTTNIEIAEQAIEIFKQEQQKGKVLNCYVHVANPDLWIALRDKYIARREIPAAFELNMINVFKTGVRSLLRETLSETQSKKLLHIMIVGMNNVAENLVIQAAQNWTLNNHVDENKLVITIVDPQVDTKLNYLQMQYPLLLRACHFITNRMSATEWLDFQQRKIYPVSDKDIPSISYVYICLDENDLGMQAGFTLWKFLSQNAQMIVQITKNAGLSSLFRDAKNMRQFYIFNILDYTCKVDLLNDDAHEALARAIHELYLEQAIMRGDTERNNSHLIPWEILPNNLRESLYRSAKHIEIMLATIGCRLQPWQEYGKDAFLFHSEEVYRMAFMEHSHWSDEAESNGWKNKEFQTNNPELHSSLVKWEYLSDDAKDEYIKFIARIPNLVAKAGFQIDRLER